jgi:ribosomal protein L11 methyltransferase
VVFFFTSYNMQYHEIIISPISESTSEILIALLSEKDYESFVEEANCLKAYIKNSEWNQSELECILIPFQLSFTTNILEPQNWNAIWESSFEPVHVNSKVAVHASFHEPVPNVTTNIIITPKMSFGTGHHSTTHLMLEIMSSTNFTEKQVLDYGCGTGVLAIYAEKLGASFVNANDLDTWCVENTQENMELNRCHKINTYQGDLEIIPKTNYDIILANINLHILQKQMKVLADVLTSNGTLIISGILSQNQVEIDTCILQTNLIKKTQHVRNEWLAIEIVKS